MQETNLTKQVHFKINPNDYANLKETLRDDRREVSSFIRLAISNELQRLKTYNKEKNQTWDIE